MFFKLGLWIGESVWGGSHTLSRGLSTYQGQTPGMLASPKKVRIEISFETRSNRDFVSLIGHNSNFFLRATSILPFAWGEEAC